VVDEDIDEAIILNLLEKLNYKKKQNNILISKLKKLEFDLKKAHELD